MTVATLLDLDCVKKCIAAVRNDKIVGAYDSMHTNTFTDEELVDHYIAEPLSSTGRCPTPAQVVAQARRLEKIWHNRSEDIRNS
jgi:hypothetical protein